MKTVHCTLALVCLSAACSGEDNPAVKACGYPGPYPKITLPAEIEGTLRGRSLNASTSCTRQTGTGGPESVFLLEVKERSIVELTLSSEIDTVVAIRTACDDPLTEVACGDSPQQSDPMPSFPGPPIMTPPPPRGPSGGSGGAATGGSRAGTAGSSFDAGGPSVPAEQAPTGARDGHVRVALNPGTYFVIVDEAEPFGVGGRFTLRAKSSPPPPHASCASPVAIGNGTILSGEELDLASSPAPACGLANSRPALFYKASIPSGQRLTARAQVRGGDRPWNAALQLHSACTGGMCLEAGRATELGDRVLRYVNNGPAAMDVILSVASDATTNGALFDLSVSIGDPVQNFTCAGAVALTDGKTLVNQDLSEGQPPTTMVQCRPPGSHALYYKATLLEGQTIVVTTSLRSSSPAPLPLMTVSDRCDGQCLRTEHGGFSFTNPGPGTKTIFIEASVFPGAPPPVFDLIVSMPLPPGSILVEAAANLRTSEGGGQTSFAVRLGSPPTAPVTIPLSSSDPAEGTASPSSLQFDPTNWERAQTVAVMGVDDDRRDGLRPFSIRVGPATSDDPRYQGLEGASVDLGNRDDEPGVYADAPLPITTSENGATTTFGVQLNSRPQASVTLRLASSDQGEATVTPAALTFTPDDYAVPQTVTVDGVDDAEQDGPQRYTISFAPAESSDPSYGGLDAEDLPGLNRDDDYQRVAPQLVSGSSLACFFVGGDPRIAVDDLGTLYVVFACTDSSGGMTGPVPPKTPPPGAAGSGGGSGGAGPGVPIDPFAPRVFVASSQDGGLTFSAPVPLNITHAGEVTIAGGPAGVAYVAATGPLGLLFTRSTDGGRTFEPPQTLLGGGTGNMRMAAAGAWVVLGSHHASGFTLWSNQQAGRGRFGELKPDPPNGSWNLSVDSAGTLWLARFDGTFQLQRSTDRGVSFGPSIPFKAEIFADSFAFGGGNLFALGGEPRLAVIPLERPHDFRLIGGLSEAIDFQRGLTASRSGEVVVLESINTSVEAVRLPAGGSAFEGRRSIGRVESPAVGVMLSDRAAAVTFLRSNQVWVGVETWP